MMQKRKILVVLFGLLSVISGKAQMLSMNTDLATDFLMTPSLGFEIVTGEHSTVGLNGLFCHNPWGKKMKGFALQPEYRYYLSKRPMYSEFAGLGAIFSSYDIHWAGKVYEGNAYGMGITFGYVLSLTKRLNVDFHAGFAAILYKQKEYFEGDLYDTDYAVNGVLETNAHGYTLLPTRLGISIVYILK